jgi:acetate kinase
MTGDLILTFNAGSSTIKVGLFETVGGRPRSRARGTIDFRREPFVLRLAEVNAERQVPLRVEDKAALPEILREALDLLSGDFDLGRVAAAGHRVVHGGDRFAGPVRLNAEAIAGIEALTALAPLHQPQSLRLIRAMGTLHPSLAQTASFDTAFHRSMPDVVRRFAIPRDLHDAGIRRYGFHGLSYAYIAAELARRVPGLAGGKVVALHLGSGASICGMEGGESRDTSMSFSTLDGIPMATRSGALDPGVLLHFLGPMSLPLAEVEDLLYNRSGLLGVSGLSADSRDLLLSDRPAARQAIDLFMLRIAGEVARIAATLGGLDALVFTAGIGEHQPEIRAGVSERLAWLGLRLDPAANAANAEKISDPVSRIAAFVIPTDEEQVIADEAAAVMGLASGRP